MADRIGTQATPDKVCHSESGMGTSPKISVVIPAYQAADSLVQTVQSVLANSFSAIEVILVEDGSSDETPSVCASLSEKEAKVTVIFQEHRGVSAARNRGISAAQGEFVAFVDADDLVDKQYLERLLFMAETEKADWVACGLLETISEGGGTTESADKVHLAFHKTTVLQNDVLPGELEKAIFHGINGQNLFSVCCGLYRKEFLNRNDIRLSEEISYGEDVLFNLEVAQHARCFVYLSEALYMYKRNESSLRQRLYNSDIFSENVALLEELDRRRSKWDREWTDEGLTYALTRIYEIVRYAVLPLQQETERTAAFHALDRTLQQGTVGNIWRKIQLRHATVHPGKMLYLLLKGRCYFLIRRLWALRTEKG